MSYHEIKTYKINGKQYVLKTDYDISCEDHEEQIDGLNRAVEGWYECLQKIEKLNAEIDDARRVIQMLVTSLKAAVRRDEDVAVRYISDNADELAKLMGGRASSGYSEFLRNYIGAACRDKR